MICLNRATILGRLTRDPEMRYTPNGKAVTNFSVATNRRFKTADGAVQDYTDYHDIVAWSKLAEIAHQYLHKGEPVYVEGRLQTRSWEAPDGAKRQRTEIIADNVIALAPKTANIEPSAIVEQSTAAKNAEVESQEISEETTSKNKAKEKKESKDIEANKEDINLDDLPF